MTTAYIGIGSNLDDPRQQVRVALAALAQIADTQMLISSSLYRSAPMGPADQPEYVNAVAKLATRLTAIELLAAIQAIETRQGRVRNGVHWGPRVIDLDLLLYGNEQILTTGLTVPHPGLREREFVLYPLAEIAPELTIPGLGALSQLLEHCPRRGLERMAHG
jgi:2-amino-4-hydroxy-6-hydroxymethyldihydropteridine diphosphokinase